MFGNCHGMNFPIIRKLSMLFLANYVGREAVGVVGVVVVRLTRRIDVVLIVRVARVRIAQPPISG